MGREKAVRNREEGILRLHLIALFNILVVKRIYGIESFLCSHTHKSLMMIQIEGNRQRVKIRGMVFRFKYLWQKVQLFIVGNSRRDV
jgi:hypothetical protein